MKILILIALTVTLFPLSASFADPITDAVNECRSIKEPASRLSCYDLLDIAALQLSSTPRFQGKRTVKTDLFSISEPAIIRYQSDGAIFVLAVHNEAGDVVQNLHIGGGGEDQYLLEEPGRYYLRVNGSTTWRIWIEQP
ncbi:hypothetical protein [Neptuniibacter caesariensis]|uniref:Uncharacterized protein n=1 Tax=Neptuniibacter caesariensis TaxID=207954 RepID=A0A7U8C950_NEPCE|nr:hypothetical protein [Neptuniibacter caesariensis]EAR62089.1 hypothetical protein MED92_10299 [Oceanospirillum sp. MED92] [Neptuniibacter caesariensis]